MTAIIKQYLNEKKSENLYEDIFKNDFTDTLILKYKALADKTELLNQVINYYESDSDSYHHHNIAGDFYFAMYDYINAVMSYQKSLELERNQAYIYYRIGIIFEILGFSPEDTSKYYMIAIKNSPDFTVVDTNLYSMLHQSKGFYAAVQWYIKQAENTPDKFDNPDLFFNLGRFCCSIKDTENAIKCFLSTTRLNPRDAKAYYNLGLLYDIKGLLDESINSLLKTVELEPEFTEAHFMLGHKYFKKMDFKQSALSYRTAKNLNPEYDIPNLSIGNIYQNFQSC